MVHKLTTDINPELGAELDNLMGPLRNRDYAGTIRSAVQLMQLFENEAEVAEAPQIGTDSVSS